MKSFKHGNVLKKVALLVLMTALILSLTGCNYLSNEVSNLKSAWKGRAVEINTYDENSQIVDVIEGKSVHISSEDIFETKDVEGNVTKKSGVINFTIDGKSVIHVGSSLIMKEKGIVDVFDEYTKTVDINSQGRSIPVLNKMVNSMKNFTTGQKFLILVRSQSGKPLATFVGNDISYFSTDIDKSTMFIIDNKALFIYRCDYTIYDLSLLK